MALSVELRPQVNKYYSSALTGTMCYVFIQLHNVVLSSVTDLCTWVKLVWVGWLRSPLRYLKCPLGCLESPLQFPNSGFPYNLYPCKNVHVIGEGRLLRYHFSVKSIWYKWNVFIFYVFFLCTLFSVLKRILYSSNALYCNQDLFTEVIYFVMKLYILN